MEDRRIAKSPADRMVLLAEQLSEASKTLAAMASEMRAEERQKGTHDGRHE